MGKKLTGALATAAAVGVIATVGTLSDKPPEDGLYPPKPASRCDNILYTDIVAEFTEAGFQNFEYEVLDDIIFGIITQDGDVESISINGDSDFDTDTLFPIDAVVSITYHTYPMEMIEPSSGTYEVDLSEIETVPITETTAAITETTAPVTQAPVTEPPKPVTEPPAPVTQPPVVTEAPKPVTPPPVVTEAPKQVLDILSVTSPIKGGQNATLSAKGKPNTAYDIKVVYSSGESSAKGLEDKTSDANGNVSWTWKVGAKTKPGTYTITVKGGGETDTIKITVTD